MRPDKKTSEKNKSSPRVSTRSSTKKQADDFLIEFGSELATLKESFLTTTERMNELIENYKKIEDRIVNLAQVVAEMGERVVLFNQRVNEINQRLIELEQERSDPPSQDPSFAEIVRTTRSSPSVVYTPSFI